jgi:predicted XRE-type DNA-binding protein
MAKRDYVESSGNVFADLNLPNADELLAKAELALQIATMIRQRHMTQMQAAAVLGVDQPKVSALMCGRLAGFSIERLLRFLLSLGADVAITIKPHGRTVARTRSKIGEARRSLEKPGTLRVGKFVAAKASRNSKKQQAAA